MITPGVYVMQHMIGLGSGPPHCLHDLYLADAKGDQNIIKKNPVKVITNARISQLFPEVTKMSWNLDMQSHQVFTNVTLTSTTTT